MNSTVLRQRSPMTALNVQVLEPEQIRMGQGLMRVTRSIGSSLGVTVTSVFFERRRIVHQNLAYERYDPSIPAHGETMRELQQVLHQAGMPGNTTDQTALRAIRRQMDLEAVAAGFRESFVLIGGFFLFASLPMRLLLFQQRRSGAWRPPGDEASMAPDPGRM